MLKSKMKKLSAVAMATMMLVGGAVSVSAADNAPADGKTPVTFDNRNTIPDGNGQYGMIIPTAITFENKEGATANADVEITGINGFNLDTDWTTLTVKTSVASANGFELLPEDTVGNTTKATYKLAYGTDEFTSGKAANPITKTLGVGTPTAGGDENVKKVEGTATLVNKTGVKKDKYTDTLTYSFEEVENLPK